MANDFCRLQLPSILPEGTYSTAIANKVGTWLPCMQALLQAGNSPRFTAVADAVRSSEGPYTFIPGAEKKQFERWVGLWSQDWKALANYDRLFVAQDTPVSSLWTIGATVWRPNNSEEVLYWLCIGAQAFRNAVAERISKCALAWLLPPPTVAGSQGIPSDSVRLKQLTHWIEKLERLSKLTPGWNRQGAPAPSKEAIIAARPFIEALVDDGQPPTRVAASAVGGVGVTRQIGQRLAYVEFYNDGMACALLADDTADERVIDIAPGHGAFSNLLDEVKAHLNG